MLNKRVFTLSRNKISIIILGGTDTKQIKDGAKQKAVENIVNVVQISSLLCLVCLGAVGTNLFLGGGQTVENQVLFQ